MDSERAATSIRGTSFVATSHGGIVAVHWFRSSAPGEFDALSRFVVQIARDERHPVDILAFVSPLTSVPDPGLFDAIASFAAATRESVRSAHIVFLGRAGFWRTIVRSLATRVMVALGRHGTVMHHPTVDAALRHVCTMRGVDLAEVRDRLAGAGIVGGEGD